MCVDVCLWRKILCLYWMVTISGHTYWQPVWFSERCLLWSVSYSQPTWLEDRYLKIGYKTQLHQLQWKWYKKATSLSWPFFVLWRTPGTCRAAHNYHNDLIRGSLSAYSLSQAQKSGKSLIYELLSCISHSEHLLLGAPVKERSRTLENRWANFCIAVLVWIMYLLWLLREKMLKNRSSTLKIHFSFNESQVSRPLSVLLYPYF